MGLGNRLFVALALAIGLSGCGLMAKKDAEIEFRYAKVEKGTLIRSISATGQVVALTSVDVKSKAGGKVVKLAVDEGSVVKKGDLIAYIDPVDTQAAFDQAAADLTSSQARANQAKDNYTIQVQQSKTDLENAKLNLDTANLKLRRAEIDANRQPKLTVTGLQSAQAGLESAQANLSKYENVTAPQLRRESQANLSQSRVALDTAELEYKRQQNLLEKGFVAGSAVEKARSAVESARSAFDIARQRSQTVESDIATSLASERKAVERAQIALDEAKVNTVNDEVARSNYREALKNVRIAEANLRRAQANLRQDSVKLAEIQAAQASIVRNKVSRDNAKTQLDSTTVLAPRDGVVTLKYLEEGTIIPPGTSTFAQGTSLVQISDTTQLFVECAVDETDISSVAKDQRVKIKFDAYPNVPFDGVVQRVNPAAKTESNITAIKVRVKVLLPAKPSKKAIVRPGMNGTCEFITLEKKDVLIAANQAIKYGEAGATVKVKTDDPKKPQVRKVEVGDAGNDEVEIIFGLREGEEVVTAEIDVTAMKETQKRMQEAQQGGGLAGGNMGGPGSRRTQGGGAGGGGAPRGGAGAGGASRGGGR